MILCALSTSRSREQSTKRRPSSENMLKVCLFYSQNNKILWLSNMADKFVWEIHEVRRGLWAWLCFSGADWLGEQTLITWLELWADRSVLCKAFYDWNNSWVKQSSCYKHSGVSTFGKWEKSLLRTQRDYHTRNLCIKLRAKLQKHKLKEIRTTLKIISRMSSTQSNQHRKPTQADFRQIHDHAVSECAYFGAYSGIGIAGMIRIILLFRA